LADLEVTGSVVGCLSALGTVGSLVGTFVAGFMLVGALPSRTIGFALGASLVILGIVLAVRLRGQRAIVSTGPAMLLAIVGVATAAALSAFAPGPCDEETRYFCVRVEEDADRPTGRLLLLDTLRHSYVDLDDPTYLEFDYLRMLRD